MAGVLEVTEPGVTTAVGTRGGAMSPASFQYVLDNTGDATLAWHVEIPTGAPFVSSVESGTIDASEQTFTVLLFTDAAVAADVGPGSATLLFVNDTTSDEVEVSILWTLNGGRRRRMGAGRIL